MTTGSLSASSAKTRQNARLPSCSRALRVAVGGVIAGMWASSRRFAWRRSPSARRQVRRAVPARIGRPTHSGASSNAEQEPAAEDDQVDQALAEADEQVQQRAAGGAQVRREVERRGHELDSTVTSPVPLWAWIWKPDSSTGSRPRRCTWPVSLCASTA